MNFEELNKMISKYDDVPFPEIKYVYANQIYANLLYDDLAGELGELSAVTQYAYEHMDMKNNEELSKIMLRIAIQEMKHLNLVGKNPCFVNSKGIIWNSGNLNYDVKDIIKTMEYNIKTEKVAIDRI